MAVIFDTRLDAAKVLREEGIEVIDIFSEEAKKRNPKRVAILNILPEKPQAETQFIRGLGYTDGDVEITFFMVESYKPKHTSQEYLKTYYKTPTELKDEYFDGLLITGADAELHQWENVLYWKELEEIFKWADTHVKTCWYSCWASMAALWYYHGIDKEIFEGKLLGTYDGKNEFPDCPIMTDIPEDVYIPHSRISRPLKEGIYKDPALKILSENETTGPAFIVDEAKKHFFVLGHWEYESYILHNQYLRDTGKGFDIDPPENYYDEEGNIRTDTSWVDQFHTVQRNWCRYYMD